MNKLGVEILYHYGIGEPKTYTLKDTFNEDDDIEMYVENLMARKTLLIEDDNIFISTRTILAFRVFEIKQ